MIFTLLIGKSTYCIKLISPLILICIFHYVLKNLTFLLKKTIPADSNSIYL